MVRDMQYSANTILLTSRYGGVRRLTFDTRRVLIMLFGSALLLCTALLYAGFRLGMDAEIQNRLDQVNVLVKQTRQQYQDIMQTRTLARDHLDALTLRLGGMQAQLLRLDTLGQRLVSRAELDSEEFDFSYLPAAGGPHHADFASEISVPDFIATLDSVNDAIIDRGYKLRQLENQLLFRDLNNRLIPSGQVVEHGIVSSKFGTRIDPFTGKLDQHDGIDVSGKAGAPVLSMGDGIVIWSGERNGYGKLVEIDHGNGYITRYGHNRNLLAQTGDAIHKGEPVALLGSTGRSTGPHVHIEVLHDGKPVNPAKFLHRNAPD